MSPLNVLAYFFFLFMHDYKSRTPSPGVLCYLLRLSICHSFLRAPLEVSLDFATLIQYIHSP